MSLSTKSLHNPVVVAVITALIMMMGIVSLVQMPAQLLPNIQKPVMSVINAWPGASPTEIESELTVPVEEVLQGTPGMVDMVAWNMPNFGFIQLDFALETDMTKAMIEVISRLNRLRPLPSNAQKPQVVMGQWGDANDVLIEYFIQQDPDSPYTLAENARYIRNQIIPEIQSLPGVSNVEFMDGRGGAKEQLQIVIDPYKAADMGVDIARVSSVIGGTADISSGVVDVGRKQYALRVEGRYDIDQLSGLVVDWRDERPILLRDIAKVQLAPARLDSFIIQNGRRAFRMAISKTNEANVLESLDGVKAYIQNLSEGQFKTRGLTAQYSFDPSVYIQRSMSLLSVNMMVGMALAVSVLWLFLRQMRATILIALAIPISLLATFLFFGLTGRSLNIISLAGLAFATGMVLDAAIVVLENIVRLREKGLRPLDSADKGATEVWGALLASTATTVAIFIPVMFLKGTAGQMFADLALTIAIAISVSLIVAVTVLPTMARFLMRSNPPERDQKLWETLSVFCLKLTNSAPKRAFWIVGLMATSISVSVMLWPTSNFLPPMNRDTIDSFNFFPPGNSIRTSEKEIAKVVDARLQPYMKGEKSPHINDYFFWSFPGGSGGWLAVNGKPGTDLDALQNLVQTEIIADIPDMFGFAMRRSLFGGFGGNDSVELRIKTTDLDAAKNAAMQGMGMVMAELPGSSANPEPDPFSENLELRFYPNDRRLAEVGWTRRDLMVVVMELGNGQWLGEYFNGQERLDVYVKTDRFKTPEEMASIPVMTPRGGVVPLGDLARLEQVKAPAAIVRVDRKRGYSLTVNPPEGMSLEELVTTLQQKIEPALRASLPEDAVIEYAGSAKELSTALADLSGNILLAILILFLLMAALFRSLLDSFFVIITLPLAAVGGVLAITLMNMISFQPLDLMGMIGFVILTGLVVNNAILLVAQTRAGEAEGLSRTEAVHLALRRRLRPIFMSTLTSLFGMLPLLLFPGEGSEIYRGMAAAIVGGMSVSTLFTLIFLPSLLQIDFRKNPVQATVSPAGE